MLKSNQPHDDEEADAHGRTRTDAEAEDEPKDRGLVIGPALAAAGDDRRAAQSLDLDPPGRPPGTHPAAAHPRRILAAHPSGDRLRPAPPPTRFLRPLGPQTSPSSPPPSPSHSPTGFPASRQSDRSRIPQPGPLSLYLLSFFV
ncbi:uncharacterized protein PGTG_22031 [Puccinia graminis f. sp. tritici CRL 75-36-700-3]|uniref:Uncharacterized protein n=1 Tax=Puccinia graminis f. sp. tritici (strain CRL 75-36-700-3 / race SCCL) TaxID=418459 RepID=H6QTC0_PUCGT|nr:uncharacterized protein PGTG_22031 [Puccinia graminis f. sp. tritici CRL 75-36-700-3]EHS64074.1 hypothetical protein PGTG_22031 [Puccinia graminis f. sp. tritici CRL 75-36-700-3]